MQEIRAGHEKVNKNKQFRNTPPWTKGKNAKPHIESSFKISLIYFLQVFVNHCPLLKISTLYLP